MPTEDELDQRVDALIEQQGKDEFEQYKKSLQEREEQPDDNNVSGL